ncbi:hypothetical protein A3K73_09130 [Candidatus Pacearchaeota archaeon RBG_13_36_9]|nr:MAG: hypothetical protein A3K73_09130 [Candidatus Pacearchaeota archaeon RBG_13_36_9]
METGKDYLLGNGNTRATYLGLSKRLNGGLCHRFAREEKVSETIVEVEMPIEDTTLTREGRVINESGAYMKRRWNPNVIKGKDSSCKSQRLFWRIVCEGYDELLYELLNARGELN